MTDQQQPEPLRLAERISDVKCITESDARAVAAAADQLCLLHAELETLTLYKNMADEYGLSIFPDIAEMTAELETLRAGYTAARMEIDSLKSQVAPAQAAPAAVAGPSDDLVTRDSAMRAIEHVAQYNSATREREAVKMLAAAPTIQPAPQPSPAAQGDALDTMRLDWLSADESKCVFHLGKSWYTRPSYGMPYRKRASLREAIDAARAAQEGK